MKGRHGEGATRRHGEGVRGRRGEGAIDAPRSIRHSALNTQHSALRLAPYALIVALILLFFAKLAFTNLILGRGDLFLYFYPYWHAAAERLRDGSLPLWNPNLFMGVPFLANSQAGVLYPLNWPLWWLLPTPYAVSASILLHLVIAGWGTYRLGQRMLGLGDAAAFLAATLFALGGYLTAQVEHVNQLQGLAWLPWVLWAVSSLQSRVSQSLNLSVSTPYLSPVCYSSPCFSLCNSWPDIRRQRLLPGWVRPRWWRRIIYDLRLTIYDWHYAPRITYYASRIMPRLCLSAHY